MKVKSKISSILLILMCLFLVGCKHSKKARTEPDGCIREYYKSGKLKVEIEVDENGIYNGQGSAYYESGGLRSKCKFINGIKVEYNISYFEDGSVEFKESLNDMGELHGLVEFYFPDGILKLRGEFSNGRKVGVWKEFFQDGELYELNRYKNDELHGEQLTYDDYGVLRLKLFYDEGLKNGKWYFFDANKDTLKIEKYYNDELIDKIQLIDSEDVEVNPNCID